ncbi:MAG: hypothetical protein HN348_17350 [Proteobacteria bacterium]|jgi:hypothetical protein|nr:hypothetical protein [Pseudomonadota bacterium]
MQYLTKLNSSTEAAYYSVGGEFASRVERYIVSTAETRDICNQPELVGCEYTNKLRDAVTKALVHAPFRSVLEEHPQHRVCVLNFLRGGLNFDIRNALHNSLGLNRQTSAFMSSQRSRTEDGRWQVREDMYRKLHIPSGAVILAGDVVATGITVANGFDVLLDHLQNIGSSIRWLVFFTIGCHKLEKHLEEYDARCREAFDDYHGCFAIYFEGKFKLVDSRTQLKIGVPGTDLIRRGDVVLSPEFEASQWDRITHPLERCTIYDAGSRAFDVPSYLEDVLEYWQAVQALAEGGFTLTEAMAERWPIDAFASFDTFRQQRQTRWRNVDQQFLASMYEHYEKRWVGSELEDSAEALKRVCAERIETIRELMG